MVVVDNLNPNDECRPWVEGLLRRGDDLNRGYRNWSPLSCAAACGFYDLIPRLLAAGALIDASGSLRRTALHHAVICNQPKCVTALLEHGASTNLRDRVGTPLYYARKYNFGQVEAILVAYGAQ